MFAISSPDEFLFGLVTEHAYDRQTDGRTDRTTTPKTALAYLRRAVKTEMLRRNGPVIHAEESLLRERIVKEVARFQTGSEKERELWMVRVVSIDRVRR